MFDDFSLPKFLYNSFLEFLHPPIALTNVWDLLERQRLEVRGQRVGREGLS